MTGKPWCFSVLVLTASLLPGSVAWADNLPEFLTAKDKNCCPQPSYSKWHYWTPNLWRVAHGLSLCPLPVGESFTSDHYAHIPPSFKFYTAPCPPADPASIYRVLGSPPHHGEPIEIGGGRPEKLSPPMPATAAEPKPAGVHEPKKVS